MNRRSSVFAVLILAALLLGDLSSHAAPPVLANDETMKLPCGHIIKVLSVSKVEYSKGVMALMVRYQTNLSVDERKALSDEVDDFWKVAQKDAERFGYREAIISSNEVPKGIFIKANRMLNFVFEKGADGTWTRLNRSDAMALQ